jgi:hypothetical protein
VIGKAVEIRLIIFPATWLKLYTDFSLYSGGFSAVLGAALAPPQILIYSNVLHYEKNEQAHVLAT